MPLGASIGSIYKVKDERFESLVTPPKIAPNVLYSLTRCSIMKQPRDYHPTVILDSVRKVEIPDCYMAVELRSRAMVIRS
jgi:hypothetical protein